MGSSLYFRAKRYVLCKFLISIFNIYQLIAATVAGLARLFGSLTAQFLSFLAFRSNVAPKPRALSFKYEAEKAGVKPAEGPATGVGEINTVFWFENGVFHVIDEFLLQ